MQCNEREREWGIIKLSYTVWKRNRKELTTRSDNDNDKKPSTFFVAYDGVSVSVSWHNNDNDNNSKFYLP